MIQAKISDVQSGYDLVADEYARRIYDELRHKPWDRRLLDRFAESVRNVGEACDLGCGPGHVARYLQGRGLQVCGMDLSERMVQQARQLNPGIQFYQGDMRALPVPDDTWAGISGFYAIVNLAPRDLAQALREMRRVIVPGGKLLLAFHIGDDSSHVEELWDSGAALEFHFFRVGTVEGYIRRAGFEIQETLEREPHSPDVEYQSRRAYIFAQNL